jgi:putative Mg2+ transporter-C (MgtC) family protein
LLDWPEIVLRLGVATLAGGLIGLNRDLHGKPIGLKTLALVGLATAMVVVLADPSGDTTKISPEASRIMQGILTGIGFLGAGVIVRAEHHFRVRGLTSAACTWLTACVGIACGVGQWRIVVVGLAITIRKSMPSDLIRGWVPVFPRDKREAFARRSCSNKKLERNDYSKKSHSALIVRCRSAPARQIDRVLAFRQSQRFLGRLFEIGFHILA